MRASSLRLEERSGLAVPEGLVHASGLAELGVGAVLHDRAVLELHDAVDGGHGGEPVGDDDARAAAHEVLEGAERGSELGGRRSVDVETIFGDIKRNWGFRRFLLRGLEKVDHEMRMVAMGHNIRKMAYALAV